MAELGQLEARSTDFARRNVRVVVVSIEDLAKGQETQTAFPHLVVLADAGRSLARAADVIHPKSGPGEIDTAAPTTVMVDRQGVVRWLFRPDNVMRRLSPDEVLAAVDTHLRGGSEPAR